MRVLLDTHILLWWLSDDPQLPRRVRDTIASADNRIFVSIATGWELAIRIELGRLEFPLDELASQLDKNEFSLLPIRLSHVQAYADLALHHRDPFDRMLIAQARAEDLTVATANPAFSDYSVALL